MCLLNCYCTLIYCDASFTLACVQKIGLNLRGNEVRKMSKRQNSTGQTTENISECEINIRLPTLISMPNCLIFFFCWRFSVGHFPLGWSSHLINDGFSQRFLINCIPLFSYYSTQCQFQNWCLNKINGKTIEKFTSTILIISHIAIDIIPTWCLHESFIECMLYCVLVFELWIFVNAIDI